MVFYLFFFITVLSVQTFDKNLFTSDLINYNNHCHWYNHLFFYLLQVTMSKGQFFVNYLFIKYLIAHPQRHCVIGLFFCSNSLRHRHLSTICLHWLFSILTRRHKLILRSMFGFKIVTRLWVVIQYGCINYFTGMCGLWALTFFMACHVEAAIIPY